MMPQSPLKYAPWDLTQFSQSLSAALSYFPESHWWSEISSLSKVILVWGEARVSGYQSWAAGSLSHLDDLMFYQKLCTDMMHEQACCCHDAANHWLPIAAAFWIIQIVSADGCSSLMHNMMQIHYSTRSVILNVTITQYTCSHKDIYCPHWLVHEVTIVHACALQSTLLGWQVTSMSCKPFFIY